MAAPVVVLLVSMGCLLGLFAPKRMKFPAMGIFVVTVTGLVFVTGFYS